MRRFAAVLLAAVAVCGCSKREEAAGEAYVFPPITAACAHIAVVEKPDAARALLIGEDAKALAPYLVNAGVKPFTSAEGRFDIIALACSEMSEKSCARLLGYLSDNGVVMWMMNVSGVSAEDFRRRISTFALGEMHLWMPGETRWLLVGRKKSRKVKLSAMLDVFSREKAFADFAFSRCSSLQELFAGYAGTREAILPAFDRGDLSADVRPEFFLERNVSEVGWISREGVDRDIAAEVSAQIRSMRKVRLEVVEGNIASAHAEDREGEDRATGIWAKAAAKNAEESVEQDAE
jgi:hypothetical protein